MCSQQQLVGQPLTLGCNPHLTSSATHMCVCSAAIGLPKWLNVQNLHMTSSLDSCATHTCVLTAVLGRPTLDPWVQPSIDFVCNTHVCVHSSNRSAKVVECSEPSHDFFIGFLCNTHVCVHSSNWSANPQLTSSPTYVCMCSQQQSVCQSF